ncbi:SH2 domain-containing protein 7 [Lycodopsis pacificus]
MEKTSAVDLHTSEGGLKELVLRWFTETQVPLLLNHGNFPNWFKGFAARKDTEDLLRDKAPGSFLIRLSDKTIGYILSYKGHDRCRHFVITQNPDGEFVIAGDYRTHRSLVELIEHHRVSPIQPFGEHLTSCWVEVDAGELYDVVNYNSKGKPTLSVQALRTLWDQKHDPHSDPGRNQRIQRQNEAPTLHQPAVPLKYNSRKLTGTVSVDTMSLSQGVPPVPQRGLPLAFSLRGSLPDSTSQTQTDPSGSEGVRGNTNPALMSARDSFNAAHTGCPEIRSTSLPIDSCRSEQQGVGVMQSNPLYQTSTGSGGGSAQQGDVMYSEVPRRPTPARLPNTTYEQIPGEGAAVQGNTYASLEDLKNKKSKSTWGKNVSQNQ